MNRDIPFPSPQACLGPAWPTWLAGDRDALAALQARAADERLAAGDRAAAAAAALLAEHQAAERFALRTQLAEQLGELFEAPPVLEGASAELLVAQAAAGLLESYAEWPRDARVDAATVRSTLLDLLDRDRSALAVAPGDPDLLLLACCGFGEWCEREGREAAFERIAVTATVAERSAAPWSRVHWRIVVAWHHFALGRRDEARQALAEASGIAREAGLAAGETLAELQAARLLGGAGESAAARSVAARVRARADAALQPLWLADAADVEAREALAEGDLRGAVVKSRQALAWLAAANAGPGYAMAYRLREVCALAGLGDTEAAAQGIAEIDATPLPSFLAARVHVLTGLLALLTPDREDRWGAAEDDALAALLHRLTRLTWPTILGLLPHAMARLFARGLDAGCETAWLQQAIRAHGLEPPLAGGAARPRLWPWAVRLYLLGPFECEGAALANTIGAKTPAKPIALLRLIALHDADGGVAASSAASALWRGEGREGREKALETTLARLRRLLGHADAIWLREQRLRLNPARVWCDWPALLRRLDRIEAAPHDSIGRGWDEVFALWRGPLLGEEGDGGWLQPWRERLRSRLAAALLSCAAMPGHTGRCLRAFSIDPQIESRMSSVPPQR